MSAPSAPAAWYPDPSSTGVLRWWDGHVWTEHTHLTNPEPSPVATVPSALIADAYGTRVSFDGQTFTVQATNFAGQGALGAQGRTIQARDITALDLRAPTMLKNGTLAVVTATGKTLVHFRRKHASGVAAVYNALTGATARGATGESARSQVRSNSLQLGGGHSVEEVAGKRWDRRVAETQSAGPSNALGRNSPTQTSSRAAAHPAVDRAPSPARSTPRLTAKPILATPTVVGRGRDGWLPPGVPVEVAGLTIPGGMVYVGQHLRAANGGGIDPALINPKLRVDLKRGDTAVGYWPSYSDITPQARGAYLTWLAGGRRDPRVPVSWPFLFFYGLERRIIVDATEPGPARDEVPLIRAEVTRLLGLYGDNHSFHSYATGFLDMIDFYGTSTDTVNPPERRQDKWSVPMGLRAALGEFAADGTPVPAGWALAWAHFHPDIYLRTPATRCPQEFEALFHARYATRHGAGLTVRATKSLLTHSYRSASAGIGNAELTTKLPDVLTQAVPGKKLAALVEDCTNSLDAYSRYLGRNPDAQGTLAATALLPAELVADAGGELGRLTGFIDEQLDGAVQALIEGADLVAFWPTSTPGKLTKADAVALAQLLGAHGVGLEPDVRLGGPVLAAGPTVLFRTAPGQPAAPSPAYSAAAILLHLAAAVGVADGRVSDAETAHLRDHLETAMHLTTPERLRLHAHLAWLLAGQTKLTGLTKRLALLHDGQRNAIGDFLTMVAAADGVVSPAEITTLTKIFKLLGLDPASVYSRVHAATSGGLPATGPVTVRPQSPGAPGYAVPPRPASGPSQPGVVRLDEALVLAKLAETAAVSALLGSIFADGDQAPSQPPAPTAGSSPVAGLDGPHSALLRALAARGSWSRGELEAQCAGFALLPDGALDTLNEAAYDAVGDPFADGDDPIEINLDVAQEMLA